MSIKRDTIEWFIIIVMMLFSFINNVTLLLSMLTSLFLLKQKEIGAVKVLNIITFRTTINPGLAINIGNLQNIKWLILFICSFYLIYSYIKLNNRQQQKLRGVIFWLMLFSVYNVIASLLFSTLPTIAIFKLISYSVVFLGVLVGIKLTSQRFNWLEWIYKMLSLLIVFSIPFIFSPIGYLRNGYSFQGITNQPNLFGIISALFVASSLTMLPMIDKKRKIYNLFLIMITIYMVIISNSRTGFISSLVIIAAYILLVEKNKILKVLYYILFSIIGLLLIFYTNIFDFFYNFLHKGNVDILYSRSVQLDGLMVNFLKRPLFGSGFAVPVTPSRSYAFSTEYIVEPGNLILAVLSYSGIVGFLVFMIYLHKIFLAGKAQFRKTIYLLIVTLMVSMGEMVFFSSNNIGIWCYMFLSVYICTPENKDYN